MVYEPDPEKIVEGRNRSVSEVFGIPEELITTDVIGVIRRTYLYCMGYFSMEETFEIARIKARERSGAGRPPR